MISVLGSGAFGTALAIAHARDGMPVTLWARDADAAADMAAQRENRKRLPGVPLPDGLTATADLEQALAADVILLALPTQQLEPFLTRHEATLGDKTLVACCKGVDRATLRGPSALITAHCPAAVPAILTGPSFAADIARGLPTALTLACCGAGAEALQGSLSNSTLRLYLTDDLIGAELGGALKNVVAIACGTAMGAGLGESARAAVMTRGFAEMQRLARDLGARPETLSGLSGFGDLALTCTSEKSRNLRYGLALGAGAGFDTAATTVEGASTARAVFTLAAGRGIDMPLTAAVADLVEGNITVKQAIAALMARPLKKE